jgi:site-specific DNA-methyltransferase (adenine-specific)
MLSNYNADKITSALSKDGIVILPPMDVFDSIKVILTAGIQVSCSILDPWYNKGVGEKLPLDEYDKFIYNILNQTALISKHIYLWGFPEIIGHYVRTAPDGFSLAAWITWYYKNCPSVIRGWRSSQNACIHYTKDNIAKLHPENFLTGLLEERFYSGNMRFVPGPSSVIEEPLIVGFVGKNEKPAIRLKNRKKFSKNLF